MKKAFLAAFLLFSLSVPASARTADPSTPETILTTEPTQTVTPIAKISKPVGEGCFGLGYSQIIVSPSYNLSAGPDTVNLLSIRYWLTDQFILEALVGGTAGIQIGYDSNDNPVNDPYWAYAWGLGVKSNLLEPTEGLLVQSITRLIYLQSSNQRSVYDTYIDNQDLSVIQFDQYQYLSVQAGLGFEYFMPFVKNLSVETSAYLEFDNNWETYTITPRNPAYPPVSYNPSTWIFKVNSPGFNLTSISIHYYF